MNYIDSSLLIHIPETDSTNNYLSKLSDKETVPEFTVVQSDFQTAGKGQRGNSWETEKGKNLLFSVILYPTFLEARRQFVSDCLPFHQRRTGPMDGGYLHQMAE